MSATHTGRNIPIELGVHPAIYGALIGCAAWVMTAVWIVFGHDTYTGLQLAVSTFFCIMFVAVPIWLLRLSSSGAPAPKSPSFRDWSSHEFDTAYGPVDAKHAVVMILLAPVAVALGITGVSVVAYLAAHGAL